MTSNGLHSQCKKILSHLQSGRAITRFGALQLYGCGRLDARIKEIRIQENIEIREQPITVNKKPATLYYLPPKDAEQC